MKKFIIFLFILADLALMGYVSLYKYRVELCNTKSYCLFGTKLERKDVNENNNEETNQTNENNENEETNVNEEENIGYDDERNYDITTFKEFNYNVDTSKKLEKKFSVLNASNSEEIVIITEGMKDSLGLELKDSTPTYTDTDGKVYKAQLTNVEKIYGINIDCNGSYIFVTKDKDIYYLQMGDLTNLGEDEIKKVNNKLKYKDISILDMGASTCGITYVILGTAEDDKLYYVGDETLYDDNTAYGITTTNGNKVIIKTNREVVLDGKVINHKYKMSFSEDFINEEGYFITTDNYLYSVDKKDLYENSKIKNIYYKDGEGVKFYIVQFENGKDLKFYVYVI